MRLAERKCDYCSECVYEYLRQHIIFGELSRVMHSCPICGVIGDGDDKDVQISIEGSHEIKESSILEQHLKFDNFGDREVRLRVGARITRGLSENFAFHQSTRDISIDPKAESCITLSIHVKNPRIKHPFLLRVYAVTNGKVYFAGKDLWFR